MEVEEVQVQNAYRLFLILYFSISEFRPTMQVSYRRRQYLGHL